MYLKPEEINEIEAVTNDLLNDAYKEDGEVIPPIKLSKLLDKYGILVKSGEFPNESISGAYNAPSKTIYVAENDPYARQVFTIAHELGHIFLHKDKKEGVFYRINAVDLDEVSKKDEYEANCFAAALLMPKEMVKQYWEDTKDIQKMSLWFGVTQAACYWRLKNLGLLNDSVQDGSKQ